MKVDVLLNRHAVGAARIRAELSAELGALEGAGVQVTARSGPAPDGALGLQEVFQFVVEHKDEIVAGIPLLTATLQIANTVLKRLSEDSAEKKPKKTGDAAPAPVVIVQVKDHAIPLPANPARVKKFMNEVEGKTKVPKKAKGSTTRRTKKSAKKR